MNIGFYSAGSGLLQMQKGIDIVANNIANVQTNGYKSIRENFSDLIYTAQKVQNEEAQTGHGVKMDSTDVMYEQSQFVFTNRDLDFAAPDDGFFAIKTADGDIKYTKDGAFYIKEDGDDWMLVTKNGENVLDSDEEELVVEHAKDGSIDCGKLLQEIGIYKFDNPYGITAAANNLYNATESSGEAYVDTEAGVLNGALELSSVDLSKQMVKLIELQRAFQFNSKMVQTADDLEAIVNNLR